MSAPCHHVFVVGWRGVGQQVVKQLLLQQNMTVRLIVRQQSMDSATRAYANCDKQRLELVAGDLTKKPTIKAALTLSNNARFLLSFVAPRLRMTKEIIPMTWIMKALGT